MLVAAVFTVPVAARHGALADPIVLGQWSLDRVTAGGLTPMSDASAIANGFGPGGFGDTMSAADVDPQSGSAVASVRAVGPDGADGVGLATVTGVETNGGEYAVIVSADGFTPATMPVSVDAVATLQGDAAEVKGAGTGFATGTTSGARSSTSLDHRVGAMRVETLGAVESTGTADGAAFADTAADVRISDTALESVVRTAGSSPEFSDGFAEMAVTAGGADGEGDMVMVGSAATSQADGAGAAEVSSRVVEMGRIRMGMMGSRASTTGTGEQDATAISAGESSASGGLNLSVTRSRRVATSSSASAMGGMTATSNTTVIHVRAREPRP